MLDYSVEQKVAFGLPGYLEASLYTLSNIYIIQNKFMKEVQEKNQYTWGKSVGL